MAVVKLKYIRNKEQIKKNLHYITHRAGGEKEKMTRQIFTNNGLADKQEFDRQVVSAGRGTVFFKFMISPDPRSEDTNKDLDLPHITRRTIRKLEKAIGRRLFFVAAVHNDHTPLRHVHGIFLVRGRLSKEHFRALQQVAWAEATREATLERKARDLTRANPRYQVLAPTRRRIIRGRGGKVRPVQPGCHNCGFGETTGIPGKRTYCPMCRQPLKENRQPRFQMRERRWQ